MSESYATNLMDSNDTPTHKLTKLDIQKATRNKAFFNNNKAVENCSRDTPDGCIDYNGRAKEKKLNKEYNSYCLITQNPVEFSKWKRIRITETMPINLPVAAHIAHEIPAIVPEIPAIVTTIPAIVPDNWYDLLDVDETASSTLEDSQCVELRAECDKFSSELDV